MTAPRSTLVSLEDTPWYHCICRCVRRAFLCGEGSFSGANFDHRRGWIVERIQQLAVLFAIDVAAYAVMSNHYHIVVRIDRERASGWPIEEVLRRWTMLFTGPLLVTRYLSESRAKMSQAEIAKVEELAEVKVEELAEVKVEELAEVKVEELAEVKVEELAEVYRERLHDLSWFMRTLNEHIARRANAEDGVIKGHPLYWPGLSSKLAFPSAQHSVRSLTMTAPRSALVSLEDTPWYHCVCRCVRRAFLCGEDPFSGVNFDHRRGWIVERIQQLAALFAIDVAAYAVMSNHYHVVVRIDRERAMGWSVEEVLKRWTTLFTGPLLVARYLSDSPAEMSQAEIAKVEALAEVYRKRLHDLSWFMRTLNEHIARRANAEDGVKGRFWEGRFKSQALLDEKALLAAMAYVDLNPVRAGLAETPEASDYTSIQERVGGLPGEEKEVTSETNLQRTVTAKDPDATLDGGCRKRHRSSPFVPSPQPLSRRERGFCDTLLDGERLRPEAETQVLSQAPLMPFDATEQLPWAVPFAFADYLELVDWTGRALRADKPGYIKAQEPKILARLGMDGERFVGYSERLLKAFGTAVGAPASLTNLCARRQAKYLRGIRAARAVFVAKRAA